MRTVAMVGLLAAVIATSGCGGGAAGPGDVPAGQPAATAPAAVDRVAAVYSAVLRHHLAGVNEPMPPVAYVLERAMPGAGYGTNMLDTDGGNDIGAEAATQDGSPIDPRIRDRLVFELADLTVLRFVPSFRPVMVDDQNCPMVRDRGVVITVAPVPDTGDRLEIGLGEFRTCLNGHWQTYVVSRSGNTWTVEGTTGPIMIS